MNPISVKVMLAVPALLGAGIAVVPLTPYAQQPSPGDPCVNWHATTQDASGQTMYCTHLADSGHLMYWEYRIQDR